MSRAFVREPDGEEVRDDQPERPQSTHANYVTPAGLAALQRERDGLLAAKAALDARAGDMEAATEKAHVERDLRWVEGRLDRAVLVDPAGQPRDKVAFGAIVTVADEDGREQTYAIVGEDEADAAGGKVSWFSPLARALTGAAVGDSAVWRRPAGDRELEVLAIRYQD